MATFDILIRGGKVIDGTGNPWFYGDVAITDDKIEAIEPHGMIDPEQAQTVIDATDHVVCPGFIDIQSHSIMPVGFMQEENKQYIAKRLPEIAEMRGEEWADTVRYLLSSEGQRISTIYFMMSEDNLALQLQQPWIKISTDAGGIAPVGQTLPMHPRAYGTFNLYQGAGNLGDTPAQVIDANGNTGGGGIAATDPPTVDVSGTITISPTAPTLPSITIS